MPADRASKERFAQLGVGGGVNRGLHGGYRLLGTVLEDEADLRPGQFAGVFAFLDIRIRGVEVGGLFSRWRSVEIGGGTVDDGRRRIGVRHVDFGE